MNVIDNIFEMSQNVTLSADVGLSRCGFLTLKGYLNTLLYKYT